MCKFGTWVPPIDKRHTGIFCVELNVSSLASAHTQLKSVPLSVTKRFIYFLTPWKVQIVYFGSKHVVQVAKVALMGRKLVVPYSQWRGRAESYRTHGAKWQRTRKFVEDMELNPRWHHFYTSRGEGICTHVGIWFQLGQVCRNKVGTSRRTKRGWRQSWMEQEKQHRIIKFWVLLFKHYLKIWIHWKLFASKHMLFRKHSGHARQTHGSNSFTMIIFNHCWMKRRQQHPDIEERKYQKQFGKNFEEDFVDKQLNALNCFIE